MIQQSEPNTCLKCGTELEHTSNRFCSHECRKNYRYRTGRRLTNGVYHLDGECIKMVRNDNSRTATWSRIKYHELELCGACNPNLVRGGETGGGLVVRGDLRDE